MQESPGENRPAILDDFFEDLLRGLQHDNFFATYEREDGVWSLLDEFDEIGIDHQGVIVEARELDHSRLNWSAETGHARGATPHWIYWQVRGRSRGTLQMRFQDRLELTHWPRACRFRRIDGARGVFWQHAGTNRLA
jgi:hypothetical protein